MNLFKKEKTLADLQDEDERLDAELSVAQKRAILNKTEAKLGKGGWKRFSSNGKSSGFDFRRALNWLKSN